MAGSYQHTINEQGQLLRNQSMSCENLGDAYETIEEMYGMIWWLAGGSAERVEWARQNYKRGLDASPGVEPDPDE